jgi:hypothetical protein
MSDNISTNPFQDLITLAVQIQDKYHRRALLLARENAAPDPPGVRGEDIDLGRLRLACLAQGRATGYPPDEVERRVDALVDALRHMLMLPVFGLWREGGPPELYEWWGGVPVWWINAVSQVHAARGPVEALAAGLKGPDGEIPACLSDSYDQRRVYRLLQENGPMERRELAKQVYEDTGQKSMDALNQLLRRLRKNLDSATAANRLTDGKGPVELVRRGRV